MTVTVYTAPACQPCRLTKRALEVAGIAFQEQPLATVPTEQIEAWKAAGHSTAPIVTAGADLWSGFRPDLIAKLSQGDTP